MSVSMMSGSNQNSFKSRREELSIHAPTMGNGCIVWHCQRTWSKSSQYVLWCQRFLLFSMVACDKKKIKLSTSIFLQTPWAFADPFHFTIKTGSTNNGFALCPRFAGTKFVCNSSFLLSTGFLKQYPKQHALNSTLPKQYPKQHPKIQPWHQAHLLWEITTPPNMP